MSIRYLAHLLHIIVNFTRQHLLSLRPHGKLWLSKLVLLRGDRAPQLKVIELVFNVSTRRHQFLLNEHAVSLWFFTGSRFLCRRHSLLAHIVQRLAMEGGERALAFLIESMTQILILLACRCVLTLLKIQCPANISNWLIL